MADALLPDIVTSIAGVRVRDIVERFGTPTFVYDLNTIRRRIDDLRRFDVIRYAQKACSNIAILAFMRRNGVLVDAVSAGEIRRALAAGYAATGDPAPIVYTADIFDRAALDLVLEHGVPVNCGSIDMIAQYGLRAPGRRITLRVNPGFGHGHSRKTNTGGEHSKHGIWVDDLPQALRAAQEHGLVVSGLHAHIGSGADFSHLARVAGAVESAARLIGSSIETLSAGGGLPTPYRPEDERIDCGRFFDVWDATRRRLEAVVGHRVSLEVEPGRYLVAEAGSLLAEIRAVKSTPAHRFYLLDAGFNDLARPIMYGAYHPMAVVPAEGDGAARSRGDVVVGGPLCESGDVFCQDAGGVVRPQPLPEARVGEHVVIGCAGAYGAAMSSNYNSKGLAAEVVIVDGSMHQVRARQPLDAVFERESIPPGL